MDEMDDHDLLIRIDERTKATDEKIDGLRNQMDTGSKRFLGIESHCVQRAEKCDVRFDENEKDVSNIKTAGKVITVLTGVAISLLAIIRGE